MNWLKEIESLELPPLTNGAHTRPSDGLCAMEMLAFIERLPHTDRPECVAPYIIGFCQGANDCQSHEDRQSLLSILPELVGTNDPDRVKELWLDHAEHTIKILRCRGAERFSSFRSLIKETSRIARRHNFPQPLVAMIMVGRQAAGVAQRLDWPPQQYIEHLRVLAKMAKPTGWTKDWKEAAKELAL